MGVRRLWAAALVVGTTRAQNCPAGSYADGGSCVVCPAGFYAKNSGSTSCNDCNAGKYISDDGVDIAAHDEKSDCLVCPAGAYAAVDGATGCELCPAGSYLDDGAAAPEERSYAFGTPWTAKVCASEPSQASAVTSTPTPSPFVGDGASRQSSETGWPA